MSKSFRKRLKRLHDAHQRGREQGGGPGGVYDAEGILPESGRREEREPEEEGWGRLGAVAEKSERGEFRVRREQCRRRSRHGDWTIEECQARHGEVLGPWLQKESLGGGIGGEDLLYMDTETTGLGEGAVAFMVGIGFWEGEEFVVEQLLMEGPEQEEAMLRGFGQRLSRYKALVTFNGKSFDVPLLKRRYQALGLSSPFSGKEHLDLLVTARRRILGRKRYRLSSLEVDLLGFRRVGDVPGREIPGLWRRFLVGEVAPMEGVLEHNRHDIVSMAALTAYLIEPLEKSGAEAAELPKPTQGRKASGVKAQLERTYRLRESFSHREKPPREGAAGPVDSGRRDQGLQEEEGVQRGSGEEGLESRVRQLRGAARILVDQGLWEQAFAVITELVALAPEDSWGLQHLSRYYARAGQEKLAAALRERLRR